MPRLSSLQSRIILFHLIAIALVTVAVPLANYLMIKRSTDLYETQILKSHADEIAHYLVKDAAGNWRLNLPPEVSAFYGQGVEGLSYAVREDGRLIILSAKDSDAAMVRPRRRLNETLSDGAHVYSVSVDRGNVRVTVAQNAQYPDVIFDDIVAYYLSRIGWFTVAILALLLAADVMIIRRALSPVVRVSRIASRIDPKRTDLRLPSTDLPRELLPLIEAVNEALDRLEKGMTLQKEFTADAAHELRTPLAVLRARVDSIPVDSFPEQKVLAALKSDIDVMSHVVSQLLEIAELENANLRIDDRVDLYAVASEVVSMIAAVAIAQGKEVALTGGPVLVRGNAAMIFRAVRNLVDNAIKHTQSGSEVVVEVREDGTIAVSDNGPGVPKSERGLIVRRFWRARRDQDGAGLGLSIVSRIAELHGAKLGISDRDGGGAVFSLSFETA